MAVFMVMFACLAVLLGLLWFRRQRKYSKLPPGPKPLPLFGNSHQITSERFQLDLTEMGRKYGDIFTIYVLTKPIVILNSVDVMREALTSPKYADVFSGRDLPFAGKHLYPNDLMANPNMEEVQVLRKLFHRGVKLYGSHLKNVEYHAQVELGFLVGCLRKMNGQAVDPANLVNQYAANIIMVLMSGQRLDPSHKALRINCGSSGSGCFLYHQHQEDVSAGCGSIFSNCLPCLGKAVPTCPRQQTEMGDSMPDCLYSLLEDEVQQGNITEASKHGLLLDAIQTGVVTTKPRILLILAAMASYPNIQKNVQKEIDKVVGRDRLPCLDDKPNLPYTKATMLEAFRLFSPVPLPGPRTTTKDCTFKGYFIPEGTEVTYNVWHVNHDESFWEDPFMLDPTRFLDQDGNVLPPEHEKRQRLLTFGLGKRACIGEVLARLRIFLVMSAILQNFDLKKDPNLPFLSPDPREYPYDFITTPPPYQLCFVPRA